MPRKFVYFIRLLFICLFLNLDQGKPLVVQGETLEFILILQNPYVFDLELQSLSLRCLFFCFPSVARI